MRSAERIGIVDLVARIAEILRGEIHIEVFAEGFSERKRKFRVTGKVPRAVAVQEAGGPGGEDYCDRAGRVYEAIFCWKKYSCDGGVQLGGD